MYPRRAVDSASRMKKAFWLYALWSASAEPTVFNGGFAKASFLGTVMAEVVAVVAVLSSPQKGAAARLV
jgi:hypothetical protein